MSHHSELDYTIKNDPDAAPAPVRSIIFERETGDYRLMLDGQFIGYARSAVEGERVLDQIVSDRLMDARAYAQERHTLALTAYRAAKAAGRTLDAQRHQGEALAALAETLGITVEQMLAEQRQMKEEAA